MILSNLSSSRTPSGTKFCNVVCTLSGERQLVIHELETEKVACLRLVRTNDITTFDGRRNKHRGKIQENIGSSFLARRYLLLCASCSVKMEAAGVPRFLRAAG